MRCLLNDTNHQKSSLVSLLSGTFALCRFNLAKIGQTIKNKSILRIKRL